MEEQVVLYEKLDRIARVTLNRPRYKNAQSRRLLEEMDAAFAEANADDDVRVIVLAGAGDNFCSGHDLGTAEEKEDQARRPFPKGVRGEYARSRQMFLDNTLRWRDVPARAAAVLLDPVGHAAAQGQGNSVSEPLRRCPRGCPPRLRQPG